MVADGEEIPGLCRADASFFQKGAVHPGSHGIAAQKAGDKYKTSRHGQMQKAG